MAYRPNRLINKDEQKRRETFAKKLIAAREALQCTQAELGLLLDINKGNISRWELMQSTVRPLTMQAVSLQLDELLAAAPAPAQPNASESAAPGEQPQPESSSEWRVELRENLLRKTTAALKHLGCSKAQLSVMLGVPNPSVEQWLSRRSLPRSTAMSKHIEVLDFLLQGPPGRNGTNGGNGHSNGAALARTIRPLLVPGVAVATPQAPPQQIEAAPQPSPWISTHPAPEPETSREDAEEQSSGLRKIQHSLPRFIYQRLKEIAEQEGRTVASLASYIIEEWVRRQS
jgi:transcriptional regulator with XRE-family HTH domain